MRIYASEAEYATWLGLTTAPAGSAQALRTASLRVDELLISAIYPVDSSGYPTETEHVDALRNATCAQAAYARSRGDSTGSGTPAYSSVTVGSIHLGVDSQSAPAGTSTPISRDAASILQQAGLIPVEPYIL